MRTMPNTQYDNGDAVSPYDYQRHEWNGSAMVPRETRPTDIRQAIEARRGGSIYKPLHIPPERADL